LATKSFSGKTAMHHLAWNSASTVHYSLHVLIHSLKCRFYWIFDKLYGSTLVHKILLSWQPWLSQLSIGKLEAAQNIALLFINGQYQFTSLRQLNNEKIHQTEKVINTLRPGFVETIPLAWLGILKGVFLANHLASTDNLTRTTKRQNT